MWSQKLNKTRIPENTTNITFNSYKIQKLSTFFIDTNKFHHSVQQEKNELTSMENVTISYQHKDLHSLTDSS